MSYDYWLMRARNPIRDAADVDEANVAAIGSYQQIKRQIEKALPHFQWNDAERYCWFKGESEDVLLHIGYAEPGPEFLTITVKAWWRDDFQGQLIALATSLGLFVFDPQQVSVVGGVLEPVR